MSVLTCLQVLDLVSVGPRLPDQPDRMKTALSAVSNAGLDMPTLLFILAFHESSFDTEAVNPDPKSSATGLFQFLKSTADDVQTRVLRFLSPGAAIPGLGAGERFVDHRTNPEASAFCAYIYLLDRIAANQNDVDDGIAAFGTGEKYATGARAAVAAVRAAAGLPVDQPSDLLLLTRAAGSQCGALQHGIEGAWPA